MKRMMLTLLLFLPLTTQAVEPVHMADKEKTQPRFFPIDTARNGSAPVKVRSLRDTHGKKPGKLRSDAEAMNNGFFRIDRKTTQPNQQPLIVYPAQESHAGDMPKITRGGAAASVILADTATSQPSIEADATKAPAPMLPENADPVLALFNANDSAALPTFRDGLSGRISTTPSAVPSAGGLVHQWPMARNVAQKITSGFGYRNDPINNKMEFHNGIDISAAMGTPVLASADGQVSEVTEDGLFGKSVSVQHRNGSVSQYGHLSAQTVSVGQQVKAGQIIGKVGATGRVTGAHLHYCVTQNGIKLDPMKLLGQPATIDTAAADTTTTSHVYPGSPMVTRPRAPSRSEKLIIVR
jgi:murein DD-endopeptidase MepM/ murein hydrolase activator NlpD